MLNYLLAIILMAMPATNHAAGSKPLRTTAEAPKAVTSEPKPLGYYKPLDSRTPMLELKNFDKNYTDAFLAKLKELDGKTKEIWVRIDTLGGSIMGGQEVIHGLEAAKSNIVCVVDWKAYSMGFFVLESQACDWRLMTKRASLMAHEPATVSEGNAGQLRDDADLLDAINEGFLATASERMSMPVETLRAKTQRRTWWLSYMDAEKWRAVDGWADPKVIPAPTGFEVKKSFLEQLLGG